MISPVSSSTDTQSSYSPCCLKIIIQKVRIAISRCIKFLKNCLQRIFPCCFSATLVSSRTAQAPVRQIFPRNSYDDRRRVFESTCKAVAAGYYHVGENRVDLGNIDAMCQNTHVYDYDTMNNQFLFRSNPYPTYQPEITVVKKDTLEAAKALHRQEYSPAILNMANRLVPGGGVEQGCPAQEEELCRLTPLYQALKYVHRQDKYPIPACGLIYTPNVPVIRSRDPSNPENFVWLKNPVTVGVISSAAYDLRPGQQDTVFKENHPLVFAQNMRKKIRAQLQAAIFHGHDSIVLGAFGCGAFQQNPAEVAIWYREELKHYAIYFRKIVFAILVVNSQRDQNNLDTFTRVFSSTQT